MIPAFASKMEVRGSVRKSEETTSHRCSPGYPSWSLRKPFDSRADLLVGGGFLQADSQVNNGNVQGGNTEGHTGQFALALPG